MSWYHARKAIRERVAANKRRYSEAPLRDALEAQAIRALREKQAAKTTEQTKEKRQEK
jgi:hypothetical protein